jgi:hypothetical protein
VFERGAYGTAVEQGRLAAVASVSAPETASSATALPSDPPAQNAGVIAEPGTPQPGVPVVETDAEPF